MAAHKLPFALLLSAALLDTPLALAKPTQTDTPPESGASETQPAEQAGTIPLGLEDIKSYFLSSYAVQCSYVIEQSGGEVEPEVWHLQFRYDGEGDDAPQRPLDLYQFFCSSGAYNQMNVYLTVDEYGDIRPIVFAEPSFDVAYQEPDNSETPVESITVTGYTAVSQLVNSTYDPDSDTITTYALWRGLGDAFAVATYARKADQFILKAYDVDASYDGEQTPERVVDYTETGPN